MKDIKGIINIYEIEKEERISSIHSIIKLRKRISLLRALSFVLFVVFLFVLPNWYFIVVSGSSLIVFFHFVQKDIKLNRQLNSVDEEKNAIERELNALKDGIFDFDNGEMFLDKQHDYSGDLDIVGDGSLFQHVNRTVTKFGNETLYNWLEFPAANDEILLRQESIKELSQSRNLIISFISKISHKRNITDVGFLIGEMQKIKFPTWKQYTTIILTIINTILLLLFVVGITSFHYLLVALFFNYYLVYALLWKNHIVHHESFKLCSQELLHYADLFLFVEKNDFKTKKMLKIKSTIEISNNSISKLFIQLAKINKRLDYRLNMVFHLFINTFLYYDVRQLDLLNQWFKVNKNYLTPCFNSLGEFEALISFANLYMNNPEWSFPKLHGDKNACILKNIGHPLLPYHKRVANDFDLQKGFTIITGSNMAGKSTFLRTVGINLVLGLAGAPMCASEAVIPNVRTITLMRTQDSLDENVSSFQAELKRVKKILDLAKHEKEILIILDEPLKGTNSTDRYYGVKALIYQLIQYEVLGMLATHDLKLTSISENLSGKISNYHFDIQMMNNKLDFDFKLKPGICKSTNARYLLEELGLDFSLITPDK